MTLLRLSLERMDKRSISTVDRCFIYSENDVLESIGKRCRLYFHCEWMFYDVV